MTAIRRPLVFITFHAVIAAIGCTENKPDPAAPIGGGKTDDATGVMHDGHHHGGDRHGLHGMLLFGRTSHYLEHIPMFARPHDEQLVMRVTLRDDRGRVIGDDFSRQGHTLVPASRFSLDDLALRKQIEFRGDVHRGNFEAGGARILRDVRVTVDDVLVARNLPGTEPIESGDQEYLLIGDPGDAYLTNYIRGTRSFQQLLRLEAIEGITPARTRVRRITVRAPGRLVPAPKRSIDGVIPKAGATAATRVTLTVGAELSCLQGPDFTDPC